VLDRIVQVVGLITLLAGCTSSAATVDVRNACSTFVAESAPRHTPELRQGTGGLELVLSFTPAENPEARAIFNAAGTGVDLVIYPSAERVRALGLENGYLVLQVSSSAHAGHIKQLLCF
jgi:hypothetical protein